jgi:penicillin-binding protein 1A
MNLRKFLLTKVCNFVSLLGLLIFFSLLVFSNAIRYFAVSLPDYSSLKFYNPPTITRLYSQDLDLLTEYSYEARIFTKIGEIPPLILQAFIAAEDKTFFDNYGIDPIGIIRSGVKNFFNWNKRAQGASTITQQVVQSFLVGKERSLDRKISEAILAYRISLAFSKEDILELYLNHIFLGNNSYGVAAAAQGYFNKELKELNPSEAAVLASLPKAPSALNPYVNPDRLKERRNWVLSRMYEEGILEEEEFIEYSSSPLSLKAKKTATRSSDFFYSEEVKKELLQLYGEESLFKDGFIIETNLDKKLQEKLFWSLRKGIENYDKRRNWRGPLTNLRLDSWEKNLLNFKKIFQEKNGYLLDKDLAIVLSIKNNQTKIGLVDGSEGLLNFKNYQKAKKQIKVGDLIVIKEEKRGSFLLEQIPEVNGSAILIENYTGRILALIGGYNPNSSYFNRATQALRQPGSSFKTFIYLAALEEGLTKDSILTDEPLAISQGKGMPLWQPKNYTRSFYGSVTLERAFAKSLNLAAIQLGVTLGLEKVYEVAARLGLYPQPEKGKTCLEDPKTKKYCTNYSLLLGAFETSPLKLTSAYATLASGGYEIKPQFINKIYSKTGEELFSGEIKILPLEEGFKLELFRPRLVEEEKNQAIVELLKAAAGPQQLNLTIGGKTGTTNNSYDTWFIGMSKDFTLGVFIGHDKPQSLGRKEIGALVARPIFIDFFNSIRKDLTNGPLTSRRLALDLINTNQEDKILLESEKKISSLDDFFASQPELLAEIEKDYEDPEEDDPKVLEEDLLE